MKIPSKAFTRKGFTLVELLVVITMIAVLAAAGFSAGSRMINKAKKVSAQAVATSLAIAVEQFYTEYSALPSGIASPSEAVVLVTSNGGNGVDLLRILAGEDLNNQNPRQIRFLSGKEARNGRDGLVYGTGGTGGPGGSPIVAMIDPWGQPFYINLDYDYDERLTVSPAGSPAVTLNGRRVAVYSLGVAPGEASNPSKLVKSW